MTDAIKRELRRRSAIEPVVGHAKAEHRMGRNFLKGPHGDAANAVLAPPATTSEGSSPGSQPFGAPSSRRSSPTPNSR